MKYVTTSCRTLRKNNHRILKELNSLFCPTAWRPNWISQLQMQYIEMEKSFYTKNELSKKENPVKVLRFSQRW